MIILKHAMLSIRYRYRNKVHGLGVRYIYICKCRYYICIERHKWLVKASIYHSAMKK